MKKILLLAAVVLFTTSVTFAQAGAGHGKKHHKHHRHHKMTTGVNK